MQEDGNMSIPAQNKLPPIFRTNASKSPKGYHIENYEVNPLQDPAGVNLNIRESSEFHTDQTLKLPPGFIDTAVTREQSKATKNQVTDDGHSHSPRGSTDPESNPQAPNFPGGATAEVDANNLSKNLTANVRLGFIRKVYSILLTQLMITAILTIITLTTEGLRVFMVKTPGIMWAAIALYMCSMYALACYPKVARSVPINYILLFIFTFCMSWMVAFISSMYSPKIVASAAILTALMMIGLTTYACFTKTDFTMLGGMLAAGSLIILGMIFLGIFITNKFYHAAISAGIILLMSMYIIFDTQLIVGKHSYKYQIDDYILAALSLYLDIVNLFLSVLQLLGSASGN